MRTFLKDYFSFTKKEYNGILILLFIITIVLLLPSLNRLVSSEPQYQFSQIKPQIEAIQEIALNEQSKSSKISTHGHTSISTPSYFQFNPNRLSEQDWRKLGLNDGQIRVLANYQEKGGRFRRKEDLKKIYCISLGQYQALEPYIQIPNNPQDQSADISISYQPKKHIPALVNINLADSTQLETIRGIGPTFANRIMKYRNRLGGFHHKEQLKEVYGIDSAKYAQISEQITIGGGSVKKFNINSVVFDEIKQFPYLSYKQMNAIIQYRKIHGNYKDEYDLAKVVILNPEALTKIIPYIDYK